ncbi:MAG: G8 domain-containing protein [Planctomycetota bacterium]
MISEQSKKRLRCERLESRLLLATTAVSSGSWNDPTVWDNGVPDMTQRAIVASGVTVSLDGTSHAAKELVVQGNLVATESGSATQTLTANWIHVNSGGVFQIGTAADRYDDNEFVVTLTGDDPTQVFTIEGVPMPVTNNDAFLMAAGGGRLQFLGKEKLTFTKLAATVNAGASQILVADVIDRDANGLLEPAVDGTVDWAVGDEIVIASSSFDYREEEVRTITAIADAGENVLITLDAPLNHRHYGEIETYSNDTRSWDIDMRAEVAVRNRSITIQGVAEQDTDNSFGDRARFDAGLSQGFGGHTMIMPSAGQITIDSVRFDRMGQTGRLGRYPIHWHVTKDVTGDVLRGSSITNSNNRGVTVHGTEGLILEGNLLHDIHGHGFFMEDGVETGNQFLYNIVLGIHAVGGDETSTDPFIVDTHDTAQQIDNRFLQSAAYWITNPDNRWVGNVAAGSEGTGFWFILPDSPIGLSSQDPYFNGINARRTNLWQFDHNSSHSSPVGLTFDRGPDIDPGASASYDPPIDPVVNYFTGYKHDGAAIYHRAPDGVFNEIRFADNATSSFNTFNQEVRNSLFVGYSRGNRDRSLPVTGHTLYDGPSTLADSHFAGYTSPNAHMFRSNGGTEKRTHHMISGISFENDGSANSVSIANADGSGSFGGNTAAFSTVLYDVDGTLTGHVGGGPGHTVVTNVGFMHDRDGSDFQPAGWNAWVTDNLYAELFINTLNPFDASKPMVEMEYTSPARQVATTSDNGTRNRISVKLDDGFYSVRFPNGLGNSAEGFRIRLEVRSGPPAEGSALLRYIGIGQTMTPDSGVEVDSWADLEAAAGDAYYRAGDNLWLKRFVSDEFVRILPNAAAAAVSGEGLARVDSPVRTQKEPSPLEVDQRAAMWVATTGGNDPPAGDAAVSVDVAGATDPSGLGDDELALYELDSLARAFTRTEGRQGELRADLNRDGDEGDAEQRAAEELAFAEFEGLDSSVE